MNPLWKISFSSSSFLFFVFGRLDSESPWMGILLGLDSLVWIDAYLNEEEKFRDSYQEVWSSQMVFTMNMTIKHHQFMFLVPPLTPLLLQSNTITNNNVKLHLLLFIGNEICSPSFMIGPLLNSHGTGDLGFLQHKSYSFLVLYFGTFGCAVCWFMRTVRLFWLIILVFALWVICF